MRIQTSDLPVCCYILYLLRYTKLVQLLLFFFFCISFASWVCDQQVIQTQFCSLLEGNTWSVQVGFQASDLGDQTTRLYTWWELRTWSGQDCIRDIWLSGPKSIKLAILKCRYQIYNWNFESKLMENCKYILVTIIKRGIFGKEERLR